MEVEHLDRPSEPIFPVQYPSCPVCGASSEFRKWHSYITRYPPRIKSPKHNVMGTPLTPLVCTRCGYVQDFVNPEDFKS